MTRTTDDLYPPQPFKGFGEKVVRQIEVKPEWRPRPGSPGIFENDKGQVRTDQPDPIKPPTRFP